FFFQAEDGIRDFHVTGVQTCALPIYSAAATSPGRRWRRSRASSPRHCEERSDEAIHLSAWGAMDCFASLAMTINYSRSPPAALRSEERRVGKDGRSRRVQTK